jgi:3-oxoacyl-[acyl-carrier protein] reductase
MARLSTLSRSVEGQVVLVTGAGSGMGRATAHLFADEGAKVAVTDMTLEGAATVAEEILDAGGEAAAWALDVRDGDRISAVVLVNNAGVSMLAPIDGEGFEAAWDMTLAVNLTAHVRMVRACLPSVSRVVNIASTEGFGATPALAAYTASKHGVIGLTRSLAVELGGRGVTVNCVSPGPIHTGMTAPIPDDMKAVFAKRRVPLARYGEPEEVAHAILSLALPASSYINGAILVVDGGMLAKNA